MARTYIAIAERGGITFKAWPTDVCQKFQLHGETLTAVYRTLEAPCERSGGPIHAIKLVREITGCDLATANDVVDFLRDASARSEVQYTVETVKDAAGGDAWDAARYAHTRTINRS